MTVLAVAWLDISINLLLFVFVVVCLLMSMIILMQRPKNEGLGAAFGSGTTDQLFGARTTNVLQKGTVYLATLFFVITLTLAVLIGKRNASRPSLVAEAAPAAEVVVEEKPASIAEEAGETTIQPEAVTPPVQVPAETPATTEPEPKPEGETTPAETPAEVTPPAEETAPAEEPKPAEEAPPAEQP
jgi:preprotein translocase subunit SecG